MQDNKQENDFDRVHNSDLDRAQQVFSPLNLDAEGRFSRKGKIKIKDKGPSFFKRTLVPLLFTFLLLVTDFIIYAGSGNLQIFENSILPLSSVLICFAIIFVICLIPVLLLRKVQLLMNIWLSVFTFLFTMILFNQFQQIPQIINIDILQFPTSVFVSILLSVTVFVMLNKKHRLVGYMLVIIPSILFLHTYYSYSLRSRRPDYMEIFNTQNKVRNKDKNIFIYLMLPNLASPSYMSSVSHKELNYTGMLMSSFLQKHNFLLYQRAYLPESEFTGNMIRQLNPLYRKHSGNYVSDTRLVLGKWSIYNLTDENIFITGNQLYDYLQQKDYQVSAYKSKDIDLCYRNNLPDVQRCVDKVNKPVTFHNLLLSTADETYILMMEWLKSMRFFNVIEPAIQFINSFLGNKRRIMYHYYDNLYVINAVELLDILYNDIQRDSGNQAYIVFLDLPSDMYIYDRFCNVKPIEQWTGLYGISSGLDVIDAYSQQTQCFIGKMENFVRKLQEDNLWDNTTLILQGISGVQGFGIQSFRDIQNEFLHTRLTTMALHKPHAQTYSVDDKFCSTSDIIADELWQSSNCQEHRHDYHEKFVTEVLQKISVLNSKEKCAPKELYNAWYDNFAINKNNDFIFEEYMPDARFAAIGIEDITPKNLNAVKEEENDK